jgi:hypothetical protein
MVASEKRWTKRVSSSRLRKCRTIMARERVCRVEGPASKAGRV